MVSVTWQVEWFVTQSHAIQRLACYKTLKCNFVRRWLPARSFLSWFLLILSSWGLLFLTRQLILGKISIISTSSKPVRSRLNSDISIQVSTKALTVISDSNGALEVKLFSLLESPVKSYVSLSQSWCNRHCEKSGSTLVYL